MRAGNVMCVCQIHNVHNGSNDMTQLRSELAKCGGDRLYRAYHLHVRISI